MFGSRNVCTHRCFFTFDGSGALFGTAMISEPLQQVVVIVAAKVQQTLVSAGAVVSPPIVVEVAAERSCA